jgi:hypothetical protein
LTAWNVFIITHRHIFDWLYSRDREFSQEHYSFVNVASQKLEDRYLKKFKIINMIEIPNFIPIGAEYAESEAIYNIYKHGEFYQNLDYIGFLHYDHEFLLSNGERNITERINRYLKDKTSAHISFTTFNVLWDYFKHIMTDESQPETLCGLGRNCYDYILTDYNQYFRTHYTLPDLLNRIKINVCSSFIIDRQTFEKMMGFCSSIIESKKLNVFDSLRRYRFQGQLMERYYSVFLAFEYNEFLDLTLPHHNHLKIF